MPSRPSADVALAGPPRTNCPTSTGTPRHCRDPRRDARSSSYGELRAARSRESHRDARSSPRTVQFRSLPTQAVDVRRPSESDGSSVRTASEEGRFGALEMTAAARRSRRAAEFGAARGRRGFRRAPSARAARRRPEGVGARARPALPVLPDRAPAGWSVAPRRVMGDRHDADLCASRRRSWPAGARVTTEWPAVRVLARGGGGGPGRGPLRSLCLTQRCERRGRVDGAAHQLAERALLRAARGRRGEHVFARLRRRSDGTRTLRANTRGSPRIWLRSGRYDLRKCNGSCTARGSAPG